MMYFLYGENSFERESFLQKLIKESTGEIVRLDGSETTIDELKNHLRSLTLFEESKMIILKNASEQKTLWDKLADVTALSSEDTTLVVVEQKPDKRSKTFKSLSKLPNAHSFLLWTTRDIPKVEAWVKRQASTHSLDIAASSVRYLVERVGLDQWQLDQAIEKLSLYGRADESAIDELTDRSIEENAFGLFEAMLRGDDAELHALLSDLEKVEDPYRVMGLLASQTIQLAALVHGDAPPAQIAKDIGVHPYGLSKLAPHAARISKGQLRDIVDSFADADYAMKSTSVDPWQIVKIAVLKKAA